MPKAPWTLDGPAFPQLKKIYEQLAKIVNGLVSFGNITSGKDNIDGVWITAVFALANVDLTLTHNLGRVPAGYIPMQKTAACDVYTGSVLATTTQITLRGTVATTVVLFIC